MKLFLPFAKKFSVIQSVAEEDHNIELEYDWIMEQLAQIFYHLATLTSLWSKTACDGTFILKSNNLIYQA